VTTSSVVVGTNISGVHAASIQTYCCSFRNCLYPVYFPKLSGYKEQQFLHFRMVWKKNEIFDKFRILYKRNFREFCTSPSAIGTELKRHGLGRCGLHSSGSGQGPVAGSCEYGNELSGSIKGGEFVC
jgi:hypothetical protein